MTDGKGYAFPSPIEPDGYQCIKVYVPRHTLYLAAFWRSYEYFGEWLAWQRDSDHTGKDVAAIWRTAIAMARLAYEAGEDCDMQFELRQNPSNPCQLQQSFDGGETWTLAFDYARCNLTIPPEIGEETDRKSALIRNFYEGIVEQARALCGEDRTSAIAALTAWVRLYDPAYSNPTGLGNLFDHVCEMTEGEYEDAIEDCPYIPFYESLAACDSIEDIYEWLNCAAETIYSTLNSWSEDLLNLLNQTAAALSGSGLSAFVGAGGGGDGGGGFGGTFAGGCAFDKTYDFTTGTHGFSIGGIRDQGEYTAGVGFTRGASVDGYGTSVTRTFQEFRLLASYWRITLDKGHWVGSQAVPIFYTQFNNDSTPSGGTWYAFQPDGDMQVINDPMDLLTTQLSVWMRTSNTFPSSDIGVATVTSIRLVGYGVPPAGGEDT